MRVRPSLSPPRVFPIHLCAYSRLSWMCCMGGGPGGGIGTVAEPGASAFSKGVTTSSSSLAAPGAAVFSKGVTTSSFQDIGRRILPDASATHSSMASNMSLSLSKRSFAWGQAKEIIDVISARLTTEMATDALSEVGGWVQPGNTRTRTHTHRCHQPPPLPPTTSLSPAGWSYRYGKNVHDACTCIGVSL